jgi:hypothetical protein
MYALIIQAVDSGFKTSSLPFLSTRLYISLSTISVHAQTAHVKSSFFSKIGVVILLNQFLRSSCLKTFFKKV